MESSTIRTSNIDPARQVRAVTKSDTTDLAIGGRYPVRLYVGGAGDVAVLAVGDTAAVTYSAVPVGTYLSVRAQKVMSTNTTATLILAEY